MALQQISLFREHLTNFKAFLNIEFYFLSLNFETRNLFFF